MKTHHVYAKCNGGHGLYLSTEFSGTRYECERYLRDKTQAGGHTHYNVISCLPVEKAERRYLP